MKKLLKLLKKIWDKIRPFLAIIALVFAVFAPMLAPWLATLALPSYLAWVPALATGLAGLGWPLSAAIGLGVAAVIDSDTVKDVIDKVGDAAGQIGGAIGGVIGSTVGGLLSSPAVWLIGGGLLLFWAMSGNDESEIVVERTASVDPPVELGEPMDPPASRNWVETYNNGS